MLSERILTAAVKGIAKSQLALKPTSETQMPPAEPGRKYMLYMHVPFCQVLCPYCGFNRYPFKESVAKPYFESMRHEMLMLEDLGYRFESIYVGGGTPTIMIDELCETLDLARERFGELEVAVETNPNHLVPEYLEKMKGRIQRLSVGVQSFDDGLLKQMDRYRKYGSGQQIFEAIGEAAPYFDSLNVDMIFNFPSQTEEILISDLEKIVQCGCHQTTFSPLYASKGTVQKMAAKFGPIDHAREKRFYELIDGVLAGGDEPLFRRSTLWTFTRENPAHDSSCDGCIPPGCAPERPGRIEEYQTNYVDYPAIGSGSITHLGSALYVNTFSIEEYNDAIASGRMSIMGKSEMSKTSLMRYRFLLDLYKLSFDKRAFERDFGVSVERGLPMEMAFMRLNGAFEVDDRDRLVLSPKGRYLVVVMYRQFLSAMNNLREQARNALPADERKILFEDERIDEGDLTEIYPPSEGFADARRPTAGPSPYGRCGGR